MQQSTTSTSRIHTEPLHARETPRQFRAIRDEATLVRRSPAEQGYRLLQAGFVVAPVVAGLDKFTGLLTNWDQYLAPQIARKSPIGRHRLMLVIGGIEIGAGLLVAVKPKLGGLVVGSWLLGIVGNFAIQRRWLDIAFRDFGLALGAFALSRMSAAR